jgi:predicted dehydrogenase
MDRRIRVGVIGTSWWTAAMHLPSLASHPRAEVVALAGRNRERAEALAATHGVARVFTDYRAMLDAAELDALVVVTPDDLHFEMTMAGLERGLHVLCEKPLALDGAQARAMARRAAAAGVTHMVGYSWRGAPHYRRLRALVEAGYVGRLSAAHFSYLTGGGAQPRYSWRYDARRSNGALGNYGSHLIDLAHWLAGDIVAVDARLVARTPRPFPDDRSAAPANDDATLTVEFAGGAIGVLHASEVVQTGERFHEQRIRLFGDEGTLEADLTLAGSDLARGHVVAATAIRGARRGEAGFQTLSAGDEPTPLFAPFQTEAVADRLFIDAIVGGRPAAPDFHEGVKVQRVMDAAQAADRARRRVAVPREGPRLLVEAAAG